jgi:two-component sensor histidine kinase
MAVVSHAVRRLLQADGAAFVLRDGDNCYFAEEDAISPLWKGQRMPMSACAAGWSMLNRKALAIPDISQDARVHADVYRPTFVRSLAIVPIGEDEPIAALGAYWSDKHQATAAELEQLQAIADAASLAAANVQLKQAEATKRWRRGTKPASSWRANPRPSPPPTRRSVRAFISRVRHEGLRPNSPEAHVFAAVCVVGATLVREVVRASGAHGLAIFATYFPATVLAMTVGGKRAGILAAALGGVAAYYFFMPPLYEFVRLNLADAINLLVYGGASTLIIQILDWYQQSLLRLRQEDAKHLTLAREQHHRVKNAVAVVEAIVQQSLRDLPDRARTINRRIRAGLTSVNLQMRDADEPRSLRYVLTAELKPYDLARFTLEGEDERPLPPDLCSLVALAAHELATNALKYGALSVPEGRVRVAWRGLNGRIVIRWRESGGPAVRPPQKRGYGSIMLRRLVEAAHGTMTMEFPPTGVTAEISLSIEPSGGVRARRLPT